MNDDGFAADYSVDDAMGTTTVPHMPSSSVSASFDAWVQLTEAFAEQMPFASDICWSRSITNCMSTSS
jgi:hypothetical protein